MELIPFDKIKYQIATAKDIQTLSLLSDKMQAIQILAKQSHQSIELQNEIAEYRIRIDRKRGDWLDENIKHGGDRKSSLPSVNLKNSNFTPRESSKLQKLAKIDEEEINKICEDIKQKDDIITNNKILKFVKKNYREKARIEKDKKFENIENTEKEIKKKYGIIYIDPPWKYLFDEGYYGQDVERHYKTMDYTELVNMNIKQYADNDCVLYMWATAPKLATGIDLLRAWGFDYKTCLIWDKIKHNMGFYASIRHEILLIGGIGQSAPTDKSYANQTDSVYSEERKEHSKKPDYYYKMMEKMHPLKTRRIELFARNKQQNWDSWGNEI